MGELINGILGNGFGFAGGVGNELIGCFVLGEE